MYQNYKVFDNQNVKVEKYIKLIDKYDPYRFFATLSFQYELTDKQGIKFASQHIRRLNKKLLGKYWKSHGGKCLTGVTTLEHANIRKRATKDGRPLKDRGTCHFHFLLHDHPSLDKDPNVALGQLTKAWEAAARSLNYRKTRKLVSKDGTDVQLFHTTGVYGYMLKEAWNPSWKRQERFFVLDGEGLIYVDLTAF
jgi:hypothetical protein